MKWQYTIDFCFFLFDCFYPYQGLYSKVLRLLLSPFSGLQVWVRASMHKSEDSGFRNHYSGLKSRLRKHLKNENINLLFHQGKGARETDIQPGTVTFIPDLFGTEYCKSHQSDCSLGAFGYLDECWWLGHV